MKPKTIPNQAAHDAMVTGHGTSLEQEIVFGQGDYTGFEGIYIGN